MVFLASWRNILQVSGGFAPRLPPGLCLPLNPAVGLIPRLIANAPPKPKSWIRPVPCIIYTVCKWVVTTVGILSLLSLNLSAATVPNFYRATRMHSAVMPWQDICLSVRPSVCLFFRLSVTRGYCVQTVTLTHILKVISPSGSPTILVFPHQTGWQYSDGDP